MLKPASIPALALLCAVRLSAADAPTPQQVEFFEKKIQPVLADHCYKCHSHGAEKIRGGLVLDTRAGVLKGGETGPAIVPGDPDKSLLIRAVRHTDSDLKMPPKNQKLSEAQIADLEAWVKMGAPDPREGKAYAPVDMEEARKHWAFQPVRKPGAPAAKTKAWGSTPVDAFILAKLEENKLRPSAPADKRTLIRRATYDLTGLPPTPEEVDAFLKDKSSGAFAKVVDRLLASHHYGERWGRHWLDVARYADTKGDQGNRNAETRFIYSYTYRDYVINAFNEDKPFDQFIVEQIAADKLPLGEDRGALAALGFLTVGNRFRNAVNEVIDDRIDVVSRGLMGLTVSCARCHDHKFDPVPTADYYSLHGIFNSTTEPDDAPLLRPVRETPEYREFVTQLAAAEAALNHAHEENRLDIIGTIRKKTGDYLLAVHEFSEDEGVSRGVFFSRRELDNAVGANWERALRKWRETHNPVFAPWIALAALPTDEFAVRAPAVLEKLAKNSDQPINPLIARALAEAPPQNLKQAAQRYNELFKELDSRLRAGGQSPSLAKKDSGDEEAPGHQWLELNEVLAGAGAPADLDSREIRRLTSQQADRRLNDLTRKVNDVKLKHPGSPARALAVEDIRFPRDSFVFVRGNAGLRGPVAPRQFLEILSDSERKPFKNGSGRLELARAIASPDNPLTARVIVNRVWLHHFGAGIVPTPSDFGLRSEPPSHPELLDYLTARFVEDGWSLKKLHRLIMLSSVYQQKSDNNPAFAKIDPGNRLLWRMNRQRLDYEAMRDTLLAVSQRLDPSLGGQSVALSSQPFSGRRTVYGWIDRNDMPELLLNFDFANPDMSSPQRHTTTVPQQALFLMNSPFVIEQARALVQRPDVAGAGTDEQTIRQLYRVLFQRAPDREELQAGLRFLESGALPPARSNQPAAWQYGFGQFDPKTAKVDQFNPLENFAAGAWRLRRDPNAQSLLLNATGGRTDDKVHRGIIRRWTAPAGGIVGIDGLLSHDAKDAVGVEAHMVSSRQGLLGSWPAKNSRAATRVNRVQVSAGETIDFVVRSTTPGRSEPFSWAPVITLLDPNPNETAGLVPEWNAEADFSGPAAPAPKGLTPRERYAQVLLLANELVFVN